MNDYSDRVWSANGQFWSDPKGNLTLYRDYLAQDIGDTYISVRDGDTSWGEIGVNGAKSVGMWGQNVVSNAVNWHWQMSPFSRLSDEQAHTLGYNTEMYAITESELMVSVYAGYKISGYMSEASASLKAKLGKSGLFGKGGKYSNLDDGLNFSNRALEHMEEGGRQVPIQTLQDAIRGGEALPDPRGSSATMYYTTMYKNGEMYNLEVLYDKATNTVYHFEYARKAMGNLPAIKKTK